MATVDRTGWLDAMFSRFHTGRISLPADTSFKFKEQIKNMVRTYERDDNNNPKATYITVGGHDHYAHAMTYCEIALPLAASITSNRDVSKFL